MQLAGVYICSGRCKNFDLSGRLKMSETRSQGASCTVKLY